MENRTILKLANKISRTKMGSKSGVSYGDPEYRVLAPIMTQEMAEVALCLGLREPLSAAEIAPLCGKPVEETAELLWQNAMVGTAFVNEIDGVDKYWCDIWVPGHMEMIVNNKDLIAKYPELGKAFDNFGKKRGPMAAGNIPVGSGPMRVIPIEQAIDGQTRSASYEEVSKYLDDNEVFSLSDCACRASREAVGEGCGHLKEDICIQMGHAAEYYIRTGRGKAITKDEAKEVIKKAEANGLMHQIPNFDGSGKTHAICNCCGCGCFAVRLAAMWQNPDMIRSNFQVEITPDNCVACGECVEVCPTNAIKLGQKLCKQLEPPKQIREYPHDTEWGPDKWNPEYRTNKAVVADSGTSPCKAECPAHIGIQGYIKLASQGRYQEALELIKTENPFPAVCGRICPRKCESDCTRGDIDAPIAIDEIKKFIAHQDLNADTRYVPEKRHQYQKPIAVIGSGPAGLSCAYFLAVEGYPVTVFERQPVLGGMLTLGIPSYRLEKDVINAEIDVLRELGVKFEVGVEVGSDISLAQLREQGFEAFYLATGAQAGRKLGLVGEDADGVESGVSFLRKVNLQQTTELLGKVVVVGGGNVAIDVARTAIRLGATSVRLVCLEARQQMPAHKSEVDEAIAEGVEILNGWGPKTLACEQEQIQAITLQRCLSVLDDQGNFAPCFDLNEQRKLCCDHLLLSVGQAMDWGELLQDSDVAVDQNQYIEADPDTFQTSQPDIFCGGDAYTGPRFAIDAIAHGKEGAISIHRFVQHGQSLTIGRVKRHYASFDKNNVQINGYDNTPRQQVAEVDGRQARQTFQDLRTTFSKEQVEQETMRCLDCGVALVDEYMCIGCGACTQKCRFDAVSLARRFDAEGADLKTVKKVIIKHAIKRKVRIAVNKPLKALKTKLPLLTS